MTPAPNQHLGWYQARKLPHYDAPHVLQFITFRLADALPITKLRQIEAELRMLPAAEQEIQRRRKVEYWLDQGLGCCALARPELARVFRQGLLLHHGRRYRLMAWCIMPNHVHVLIECRYSLARIVQSWKSYSARWAVEHNERLGLGLQGGRVWMRGYWDRYIRDERHLTAAVHYIHSNPVTAGLVKRAEDWQWSSAGRELDLL
ncbi:REP-associated tyrosine transposase [Halopseudomonas formosensis]|uniref:Transposase n=1 Tax=Halopseudomonas formosensis TaxID=1002526 RepID=A0ABU5BZK5_9GAMM|nr:transposase [Halopseudomonas formosensis]MDX9688204.1 transposase [Halopseudomonas formosensis]